MSVWGRYEGHGLPSLVTTNVAGRDQLLASPAAAGALFQVISEVRRETAFKLLAFVIMPDHIHIVLVVPKGLKLGRIMQLIKGRFANRYNHMAGRTGALWQSRYHERALRSERAAIEYVHNNPVVAGLTSQADAFPWSSTHSAYKTDLSSYLD